MTSFPVLADRVSGLVVASPYSPGSGALALTQAPPFSIPAGGWVRLTITSGPPGSETFLTHLKATGISGSTFTGVVAMDGYADVTIPAGSFASIRNSAELLNAMAGAINGVESSIAGFAQDAAVVHLAGTETITGAKTFSTPPVLGTITGIAKFANGTPSAATPGTDYYAPGQPINASDVPAIPESSVTGLSADLAAKAPLASPALTGTPTAPTAAAGTSTTQIATTAFVAAAVSSPTGVVANTYTNATITVSADGRITQATQGPTLGTAASKAASGTGGTVASVSGTFTVGHLATFSDTAGTIQDGGPVPTGGGGSPAIGSSITGATSGSLLFADASADLAQDNAHLFWDAANHRLGIGTATPTVALEVAGGLIKGGTYSATQPVTLDLSNNSAIGYTSFKYPNNGQFTVVETGVIGTNDVFFQAFPGTTAGYGYLEAYNAAGMCVGTGNGNPVLIRPNRTTTATFALNGATLELVSPNPADLTLRLKGASSQSGDFLNCLTYGNAVVSKIDRNGAITCGTSATAGRPAVSSVGTMWYDTTLNKPIWWDGSAWRDATGATA